VAGLVKVHSLRNNIHCHRSYHGNSSYQKSRGNRSSTTRLLLLPRWYLIASGLHGSSEHYVLLSQLEQAGPQYGHVKMCRYGTLPTPVIL